MKEILFSILILLFYAWAGGYFIGSAIKEFKSESYILGGFDLVVGLGFATKFLIEYITF